ncbi:MAG TPA: hypothetical protein PLP33_25860 [Leptospiraceae bacterium]|nr:hypothetical protein [Leptospiraceae bacterium]
MPTGYLQSNILVVNQNDAGLNLSTNIDDRAFGFDADESLIIGTIQINSSVSVTTIDYDEVSRTGFLGSGYSNIFYNRIWIIPPSIDLTGAPNSFTTTVSVWNSYFTQKTMTTVTPTNVTGIVFNPSVPKTFNALEFVNYNLSLSSNPPVSIDGNYQFIFSDAEDPYLTITGVLSVTFPFLHDWVDGSLVERYSFLTNVIESKSGKEQRIRLRKHPRRQIESKVLTADSDDYQRNALQRMLFHNQTFFGMNKTWLIPVCADYEMLNYNVPSGTSTINVDTRYKDYTDDGYVMLFNKYNDYEIVRIDSLTTSSITLVAATTKNWNAGTTIAPMRQAVVGQETISGSVILNEVEAESVLWDVLVQDSTQNRIVTYSPTEFYKGYDVYDVGSDFAVDNQLEIYNPQRRMDANTGIFKLDSRYKATKTRTDLNLLLKSKKEIGEFLGFYFYRAGKLKPFWYLNQSEDLQIAQSGTGADTTIKVKDIGYSLYIREADTRKDIVFIKKDGTKLYRRITGSVNNSDGTETLSIDAPLGFNFNSSDFSRVSFMRFVRLDSDLLELSYPSTEYAVTTLRLIDVFEIP